MKKFKVTFWRGNPQLRNGGYKTTRTVEARTESSAWKKAEKMYCDPCYGSMTVIKVELEAE